MRIGSFVAVSIFFIAACGDSGLVQPDSPGASNFDSASATLAKRADGSKVSICHFPPDDPDNPKAISVGSKAAAKHIAGHDGDGLIGEEGSFLDEDAGVLYDADCGFLPPPPVMCPFPAMAVDQLENLRDSATSGRFYWLETPLGSNASVGTSGQVVVQYAGNVGLRNRIWLRVNPSKNAAPGGWGHPPKSVAGENFLWGAALPNNGVATANVMLKELGGGQSYVYNRNGSAPHYANISDTAYPGDDVVYLEAYAACETNIKSVFSPKTQ